MKDSGKRKAKRAPAEENLDLSKAQLDALVEEATIDAYGDSEQATGFFTMIEDNLRLPFETEVLGLGSRVIVESIDLTDDDQLVAVCAQAPIASESR